MLNLTRITPGPYPRKDPRDYLPVNCADHEPLRDEDRMLASMCMAKEAERYQATIDNPDADPCERDMARVQQAKILRVRARLERLS